MKYKIKEIQGFAGYFVDTEGKVWSSLKLIPKQDPKNGRILGTFSVISDERKLKIPKLNGDGYESVSLRKDGKHYERRVNRLVAETFIPNPERLPIVCHKDNSRANNRADNLRWDTVQGNVDDRKKFGTQSYPKGSIHGMSKLNERIVAGIKRALQKGVRVGVLARAHGISHSAISNIGTGKRWTHVVIGLLLACSIPSVTNAISIPWDRFVSGGIRPLYIMDTVFGNIFTATSTTQASTFPYASTTAFSFTSTSTGSSGINLSGGCFAFGGVCINGGGTIGAGTTGQVAYYNATNAAIGTSTIFIDTMSDVGIGTTTPAASFVINGTTGINLLQVATSTNQSILVINQNGRTGIGATTPQAFLDVLDALTPGTIPSSLWYANARSFYSTDNAGGGTGINSATSNAGSRPIIIMRRSRGDLTTPAPLNNADAIGAIIGSGYDGVAFQNSAQIAFTVDAATSTGVVPIGFGIFTGTTGNNRAEKLTVNSSGNVGIGTTTPTFSLFNVFSTIGASTTLGRTDASITANDGIGVLQFYADDTSTATNFIVANIEAQSPNTITTDINPGRLIFRTTPTDVAGLPTERLRITETGSLGVGSTTPWGLLSASSTSAFPALSIEQLGAGPAAIFLGGNVGIGTTTPGSLLSAQGIANWTTATSTFYSSGGLNLTGGGCFAVGGVCLSSTASGIVGSGTTGQMPFYAANGTTLTATSTLFLSTASNVGIGTTSPGIVASAARKFLTIQGNSGASVIELTTGASSVPTATGVGQINFINPLSSLGAAESRIAGIIGITEGTNASNDLGGALQFFTHVDGAGAGTYTEKMRLSNSGSLGIGTTTQNGKFAINAGGSQNMVFGVDSNATTYNAISLNGTITDAGFMGMVGGGGSDLNLYLQAPTTGEIRLTAGGTGRMFVQANGNVSIGTTTPFWTLTVASSTGPQLALVDKTSSSFAWTFRSINNYLYIATSTALATSSVTAFTIDPNGNVGINDATPGDTLSVVPQTDKGFVLRESDDGFDAITMHANTTRGQMSLNSGGTANINFNATNVSYINTGANFGISTTTPWGLLSLKGISGVQTPLFAVASSTNNPAFVVAASGHISASSTSPVLSGCGTSPSMVGSDSWGTVTAGATSGGCTVTFQQPWAIAPVCTVTPQTGSVVNTFSYAVSATAITVTETAFGTGKFDYHCFGVSPTPQ